MTNINNQFQSLDKISGLEDLNHENAAVCSGGSITLYDGKDNTGLSVTFSTSVPNLGTSNFDNVASSIRITPGETWRLFRNVNYGGLNTPVYTAGAYNLGLLFNNQVSSVIKLP